MGNKGKGASLETKGFEKLIKTLEKLKEKDTQRIARESTRKGAEIIMKSAKQKLHVAPHSYRTKVGSVWIERNPKELHDALMMVYAKDKKILANKTSVHKVGFLKKINRGIGNIAAFIEYGTSEHPIEIKRENSKAFTVMHPGIRTAKPFMRTAVEENKQRVKDVMKETLSKGIKEVLKK